jgi:1-acyl-sn-glycerol-3-phosphate acyltransferase
LTDAVVKEVRRIEASAMKIARQDGELLAGWGSRVPGGGAIRYAGDRTRRWIHGLRYRERHPLDYARLRWYPEVTTTYRLTAHGILPAGLRPLARVTVTGLDNVPRTGPVILAANHRDNLDAYLLLHLVPRYVHVAARPDGFGTGGLCAIWRRLGAFPADAWGIRYGLGVLADGGVVALFPQGMIARELTTPSGAVGVLALHSGAPVVPIAIQGTEAVHVSSLLTGRVNVRVRFGTPLMFSRDGPRPPRSRAVAQDILHHIGALLAENA